MREWEGAVGLGTVSSIPPLTVTPPTGTGDGFAPVASVS